MMNAKMKVLDHVIDMMNEHMLGRAKRPGAAPAAEERGEKPQDDLASVTQTMVEAPADDLDPEMAKQLMEMYQGDEPVDVNADY